MLGSKSAVCSCRTFEGDAQAVLPSSCQKRASDQLNAFKVIGITVRSSPRFAETIGIVNLAIPSLMFDPDRGKDRFGHGG